jgi:hypothetical protein
MAETLGFVEETWGGRKRRFKMIRCSCGSEMTLFDGWANECNCGTEYNGSGQRLAARRFWGEETGESF